VTDAGRFSGSTDRGLLHAMPSPPDERLSVAASGLTVRDVLEVPELRGARCQVLTGEAGLDRPVRWVHISELPDIAPLLNGGELVLTTGIALPASDQQLRAYIAGLQAAGASGLLIELGRRFTGLPDALVDEATSHGFPLVAITREVRFVRVTEEVHGRIINAQMEILKASERIQRRFTELTADGASTIEIVTEIARVAENPVVLENLSHQVVAYETFERPVEELLDDWERRSRCLRKRSRTEFVTLPGSDDAWIITDVGARGEQWGRLLMPVEGELHAWQADALERGATAIALNRLIDRERQTLTRQAHRSLLHDIRRRNYTSAAAVIVRALSLGVQLSDRALIGFVVDVGDTPNRALLAYESVTGDHAELVAEAARSAGVQALVGIIETDQVAGVLSVPLDSAQADVIDRFAKAVHRAAVSTSAPAAVRIGVGATVDSVRDLHRSLIEAQQVVDISRTLPDDKTYYSMLDIEIRGLLYLLRDDSRLQVFIERELAPLLSYDDAHDTNLVDVLRIYVTEGGNKSTAADRLQLSRPSLYQRLETISQVLQVDLSSVESRLSLHVALLGLEAVRWHARDTESPATD
jgi:purine catabolism regulator